MSGVNQVTFTDKVKTRTLPIPAINKGRDVDFNELKSKHNALDSQMTDPATGLVTIVANIDTDLGTAEANITNLGTSKENTANKATDFTVVDNIKFPTTQAVEDKIIQEFDLQIPTANTNQVTNNLGVADIVSLYDKLTSPSITFQKSADYGSLTLPIYDPKFTVTITGAIAKNSCDVYHSGLFVPTVFIPAKPTSLLSDYADQAAMLAGQAGQVSGQYYFYVGSTSAWKYNGGANGLISDYTERLEVSGWQTYGTMPHTDFVPTWLKITGTYLTGADNVNLLSFTYYEAKKSNTTDVNFVECVITQLAGKNSDPNRIITVHKVIDLDYNDFASPVLSDSVTNKSIYGASYNPVIVNPSEADFRDLGDGKYGLEMGFGGSSNPSIRSHHYIDQLDEHLSTIWDSEEITVIQFSAMAPQSSFTRRVWFSMIDPVTFAGFGIGTGETISSNLRMTLGNGTSNGANTADSTAAITFTEDEARYFVAATFIKTGPTTYTRDYFWSSLDKSQPFVRLGTSIDVTASTRTINAPNARILLNRRLESDTTIDPEIKINLQVFNKRLTEAQIQVIRDTIDIDYI